MSTIFPPEIIHDSTESLFARRKARYGVIYAVTLLAVAAMLVALPFVRVSLSAQARGIIRTPNDNNQIQSAVYGEVLRVNIAENKQVQKGDTLVALNSQNLDIQMDNNIRKIAEDEIFIADIKALLAENFVALYSPKYMNEGILYQSSVNQQQTQMDYLKNELAVTQGLYEKKVVTQSELLQAQNIYNQAVNQRNNTRETFRNRWQAERTQYAQEICDLQAQNAQLVQQKTQYMLLAPTNGSIIQFTGIEVGNFIVPAQVIAQISAEDDLLVECYVSPSDIGYIKENQTVKFQMDAFNYNQWLMALGSVREISKDVVAVDNQPVFCVRCSLDNNYLALKNGYRGYLKKGMTLTARFSLTERTLWQLLFDKVDDWFNPKMAEL
ncbi:MAG: HlyD family secretion protein [Tannerella sp.]|jgi:HlyD family secretion protein|nr:HlyD family secretion protein [Tannerella sp.]